MAEDYKPGLIGQIKDKLVASKQKWAEEGRLLTGESSAPQQRRLPPGQRLVRDWPVLDLGVQPNILLDKWQLTVGGLVEKPLKPLGGIRGTFTKEQSERYDARVEVEISAVDGRGLRSAKAMTTSSRSRTVPEDATLRQRQVLWYELTERVMQDFDRTFEAQIRKHLAVFLK